MREDDDVAPEWQEEDTFESIGDIISRIVARLGGAPTVAANDNEEDATRPTACAAPDSTVLRVKAKT